MADHDNPHGELASLYQRLSQLGMPVPYELATLLQHARATDWATDWVPVSDTRRVLVAVRARPGLHPASADVVHAFIRQAKADGAAGAVPTVGPIHSRVMPLPLAAVVVDDSGPNPAVLLNSCQSGSARGVVRAIRARWSATRRHRLLNPRDT